MKDRFFFIILSKKMSNIIKLVSHEAKNLSKSPISKVQHSYHLPPFDKDSKQTSSVQGNNDTPRTTSRQNNKTRLSSPLRMYVAEHESTMHRSASDYNSTKKPIYAPHHTELNNSSTIHSKMGLKIRNMIQPQPNENKQTPNINNNSSEPKPSVQAFQKIYDVAAELTNFKSWVSIEMGKFHERIDKNEHRIHHMDKHIKKQKQGFSPQQTEQLNKILTLVEKSANRQEGRKMNKMIQQLRQNILDVHSQIRDLTSKKDNFSFSIIPSGCNHEKQLKQIRQQMNQYLNKDKQNISFVNKIKELQDSLKPLKEGFLYRQNLIGKMKSKKQFEGSPLMMTHQEIIKICQNNPTSKECQQKADQIVKTTSAVVAQYVYYLDKDGHLLDENKFYLLNQKQQMIHLSECELQILRKHELI